MSIAALRTARGWSQADLARAAGVPRPTLSAVETGRTTPSVLIALALARALGTTVEALFGEADPNPDRWASPAGRPPIRYWAAQVGPRRVAYPIEPLAIGALAHDGVLRADGNRDTRGEALAARTLVLASCDPAVGLLARPLAARGVRLLPLVRTSREALRLLRDGLVHAAGVHFSNRAEPGGNATAISRMMRGQPQLVLQLAEWSTGVITRAEHAELGLERMLEELTWINRPRGAAARALLDRLAESRRDPSVPLRGQAHEARDHRAVAEIVAAGAADAGIGPRLAAEEAGLAHRELDRELYDLCVPRALAEDPRIAQLIGVIADPALRRTLDELPGVSAARAGASYEVA